MKRDRIKMLSNIVRAVSGETAKDKALSKALLNAADILSALAALEPAGSFNYVPASKNCGLELWEHWDDDYPNTVKLYKLNLED